MKQTPGDIIILHMCTINGNHMMYGSWQNFLSFWTLFYPFTPSTTKKIKSLKKGKKTLKILSFYKCVSQMTIIWCMVPEIVSTTDRIFCHFGLFFALLSLQQPEISNFWKNEKNTWRYYHFTHVYHKWCMVPEISTVTNIIVCHFALLPP